MLLDCVEISEPAPDQAAEAVSLARETGDLSRLRTEYAALSGALKLLDKYAPAKGKLLAPKPEVSREDFLDESTLAENLALAAQVEALDERIRNIGAEESRQAGRRRVGACREAPPAPSAGRSPSV